MEKAPAKKLVFCSIRQIADDWVRHAVPKRSQGDCRTDQHTRKPHNACGKEHDKGVDSLSHTAIA